MPDQARLLTTKEVAGLFGVSTETVNEWARKGDITAVTLPGGRGRRYPTNDPKIAEVIDLIGTPAPSPEAALAAEDPEDDPFEGLDDNRETALNEAVTRARTPQPRPVAVADPEPETVRPANVDADGVVHPLPNPVSEAVAEIRRWAESYNEQAESATPGAPPPTLELPAAATPHSDNPAYLAGLDALVEEGIIGGYKFT